eukprot:CAMPEP_0197453960 /NCGR_PEP_ID=MMETSP1175-20131217/36540_1 /TAXON_ID=1003142 /ORGANISM="Triceratium dubium, Strain CCMP147" /LENGTH=402 /DNA_ID=CAMNT_0042987399 /DNA_START=172 /DNA_END=1380 /DNA_ORIENTATION=+
MPPHQPPQLRSNTTAEAHGRKTYPEEEQKQDVIMDISTKSIEAGSHINIPPPESRIGPNGEKGYIHNAKFLLENPKPLVLSDLERESICAAPGEGDETPLGYAALENIRNHIEESKGKHDVELFCAIYTYSGGLNHTNAASETWAKRCDGVLYASDNSNLETGHVHLPSSSPSEFGYEGMIQRTRTILAYLYDNFLDDYEFFHISGEDVFVIVENLKEFLATDFVKEYEKVPNQYIFAGFPMKHQYYKNDFLCGGPGYTMSRKMLKAFVEGPLQTCQTKREGPNEDIMVSECAKLLNENYFIDTRDSKGAHRYHPLSVQKHANFAPNGKLDFDAKVVHQSLQWMNKTFGFPAVYKDDYISNSSVVFHKTPAAAMRRLEVLLYMDRNEVCNDMETSRLESIIK